MSRNWVSNLALCALAVSFAASAFAASPAAAQSAETKPAKAAAKAAVGAAAQGAAAAGTGAGDSGLKSRVDSLEEQLVDMQVIVGTLESVAKQGATSSSSSAISRAGTVQGGDGGRIEALETQIRALQAQVSQLSESVRALGGGAKRTEAGALPLPAGQNLNTAAIGNPPPPTQLPPVASRTNDEIGGIINGSTEPPVDNSEGGAGVTPGSVSSDALPPAAGLDTSDPKKLYETAYGYLLQRDYGAAEVAFDEFLKKYPQDSLSGNAQYWLGESHYVRGQYKAAAGAFLKGYQNYGQSGKAPDSLLKLAMSLDKLGQKDAACSSYAELNSKFPNAPQTVKSRAQSERQRAGCT